MKDFDMTMGYHVRFGHGRKFECTEFKRRGGHLSAHQEKCLTVLRLEVAKVRIRRSPKALRKIEAPRTREGRRYGRRTVLEQVGCDQVGQKMTGDGMPLAPLPNGTDQGVGRSEEHTSEL